MAERMPQEAMERAEDARLKVMSLWPPPGQALILHAILSAAYEPIRQQVLAEAREAMVRALGNTPEVRKLLDAPSHRAWEPMARRFVDDALALASTQDGEVGGR